ncbi:hypothetical protein PWT90_03042 [Aphanocladium album]|nr:hypothetical protein PWT90_03042 [Aphanocladium album]
MVSGSKPQLGWEELPTEIKMATLSYIRDLGSLGALLHASPSAYRLFGDDAVHLAEAILKSAHTAGHTAVLFRLCTLIRSGKLPISNTDDFLERVTREALTHGCRIRESSAGLAPRSLEPGLDPAVVRGLLVAARHVTRLAGECLQVQHAQFETLKPKHVCSSASCRATAHDVAGIDEQSLPPKGFSWEEEQRVVRATRRVQLIYELKRAVFVTKILDWETPDSLEATPAIALPTEAHSFYGARGNYVMCRMQQSLSEELRHSVRFPTQSPEYEEILAVAEFLRERHGEDTASRYRRGLLCLAELAGTETMPPLPVLRPARADDWKSLIDVSTALAFHRAHKPIFSEYDSTADASFGPFARFGLAFWSATRLWQAAWAERINAQSQRMCLQLWYSVLGFEPARNG